eukprot:TRINITY_DN9512_c0_g1_i8.p2 TRINITY_DN9512_c0_g1~~TRINITY_DN9512_c0_g1_i8.p2  ORF type:complete len:119 (-),score=31.16 TRINITY_DN9512_c0_g1_i8:498-854(-)
MRRIINMDKKSEESKSPVPMEYYVGNTRCVSDFEKIKEIGEGTFGTVCTSFFYRIVKAKDKKTNEIIALKKVRMSIETEGFPVTSLREIQILQELNYENVVKLKEVVVGYRPDKYLNA